MPSVLSPRGLCTSAQSILPSETKWLARRIPGQTWDAMLWETAPSLPPRCSLSHCSHLQQHFWPPATLYIYLSIVSPRLHTLQGQWLGFVCSHVSSSRNSVWYTHSQYMSKERMIVMLLIARMIVPGAVLTALHALTQVIPPVALWQRYCYSPRIMSGKTETQEVRYLAKIIQKTIK